MLSDCLICPHLGEFVDAAGCEALRTRPDAAGLDLAGVCGVCDWSYRLDVAAPLSLPSEPAERLPERRPAHAMAPPYLRIGRAKRSARAYFSRAAVIRFGLDRFEGVAWEDYDGFLGRGLCARFSRLRERANYQLCPTLGGLQLSIPVAWFLAMGGKRLEIVEVEDGALFMSGRKLSA